MSFLEGLCAFFISGSCKGPTVVFGHVNTQELVARNALDLIPIEIDGRVCAKPLCLPIALRFLDVEHSVVVGSPLWPALVLLPDC